MLFGVITFLSKTLIFFSIVGFLFNWIRNGIDADSSIIKILPNPFKKTALLTVLIIGVVINSFSYIFFYAEPGMSYLVQYPWGTQKGVLQPGIQTRWFGEVIPFKKFLTVSFGSNKQAAGKFSGSSPVQQIRFHDSVTSDVKMTARFQLPQNENKFLPMAIAYRSQDNLIYSTLIPIMQEAMRNSGRMYSAQEYIGGKGGDFENAVLDQIRNGIFLLNIEEERTYGGEKAVTEETTRTVQQDQTVRVRVTKRMGPDGLALRKDADDHPLKKFNITLVQANVQDVDPDPAFKDKLREQREAAAQVAIERQKARQEEERKKRIIAQGEAEKAEKKIELEKAQIEKVLAAETKAKEAKQEQQRRITESTTLKREAEIEKERKKIELATAKLEAQRIKALAAAEAEKRRKLMQADNALEKRLDAYIQVSLAYADALQNKQLVPGVVINGSEHGKGQSNATDLISLLMAKTANDLSVAVNDKDMKKKK